MDFLLQIITLIGINCILAISLNYTAGFSGILSMSHASFFGIGAYTSAILLTTTELSFVPAVACAIVVTGVIAWLVSYPILRLKDDSLMLVSVGFALIMHTVFLNLTDITGGARGIKKIPAADLFGFVVDSPIATAGLAVSVAAGTYALCRYITKSPYGTVLQGIRENEIVMQNYGFNTQAYKRSAFIVGAIFAAIAGTLQATYIGFIEPSLYILLQSVFILIMVLLGGLASLPGSILGAIIITIVPELLRLINVSSANFAEVQQIIYGVIMYLLVLLRPKGIFGKFKL